MERSAALSQGFPLTGVERPRFGMAAPQDVPGRTVSAAGARRFVALAQANGADVKEAGNPSAIREGFPACELERETGFEPATLSLGS